MPSALALLTQKNEGAFLLEWFAHHIATGFDKVLVYSNDCVDGSDLMLDRLSELGYCDHVRNDGPYDDRGIQFTALKLAEKHPLVKEADWILSMDVDEFVNIKVGDHTLSALWSALPEATAITLTWRLFGNNNIYAYEDLPIREQFTKAAPATLDWPWRAFMIKTLYKNDGTYRKLGVHRPRNPDTSKINEARWFDGSGRRLGNEYLTKRLFSHFTQNNYDLVQMNHYPLGAMQSFILKVDRGRSGHSYQPLGMDYWTERNYNTESDTSILALNDTVSALMDRFLSDPQLAQLHDNAVAWRHRQFETLMAQEPMRALLGRMMVTPQTQPISPENARILVGFAQNAQNGA